MEPKDIQLSGDENGLPVIIIGAGCTGLAIANGLKKAGINAIVFEKHGPLSISNSRDWNMGFHWGEPSLKALIPESSFSQLQTVQTDPHTPTKPLDSLKFLNGATGDLLVAHQMPYFHRLRRSKLRTLLIKDLDIRWNKRLQNIIYSADGQSVTAIFEDGEQVIGRLIIGADSARSTTRKILLGPEHSECKRLPYAATFVQGKYTREQALFLRSFHPLYLAATHPAGQVAMFGLQDASQPDKPEDWTFFFYISWRSSFEEQDEERKTYGPKERLEQLKAFGKEYTEPWKSAFEWVQNEKLVFNHGFTFWDPREEEHNWDNRNGRVTLAGDAAHAMTYQRGQGLNHSITDAEKLVELLTTADSQVSAINKYEEEMKARAGEEVHLSVINTAMLHDWDKAIQSPLLKSGIAKK